jgi:hypothetical protein
MTTTKMRVFVPNAALIPASAVWRDSRGQHVNPEQCTMLFIDGNRNFAEVYTREAWEQSGKPSYVFRDHFYFKVGEGGEEKFFCRAGLSIKDQEPVEGNRIQLLPEMFVVKQDETDLYDKAWVRQYRFRRIIGVYVFNRRRVVHCCEITPSYERQFFGSQCELDLIEDDLNFAELLEVAEEELRSADAGTEQFSYQHCSDVDRLLATEIKEGFLPPEGKAGGGYQITGLVSVTDEDAVEEVREYTACHGDL